MTRLDVFPAQKREEGDPRFFWGIIIMGTREKIWGFSRVTGARSIFS